VYKNVLDDTMLLLIHVTTFIDEDLCIKYSFDNFYVMIYCSNNCVGL